MSNLTSDIKLIKSWPLQQMPSDFVQIKKTEWAVFCAANEYWSFSSNEKEAITKSASTELFKVEQAKDGYLILSYNDETRLNQAWKSEVLDLSSKTTLALDDAADIAYSSAQNQLYWINQSRAMMVCDLASQKSTLFMEGQTASLFSTSANGNYLAVQGTDKNIVLIDLSNNSVVLEKKSDTGQNFKLVGATDDGHLILLEKNAVQKNGSTPDNKVLLYSNKNSKVLVEGKINWAAASGKSLLTWGNKTLTAYEL